MRQPLAARAYQPLSAQPNGVTCDCTPTPTKYVFHQEFCVCFSLPCTQLLYKCEVGSATVSALHCSESNRCVVPCRANNLFQLASVRRHRLRPSSVATELPCRQNFRFRAHDPQFTCVFNVYIYYIKKGGEGSGKRHATNRDRASCRCRFANHPGKSHQSRIMMLRSTWAALLVFAGHGSTNGKDSFQ